MELLVEIAHGADSSTDVAVEVEPGATFGDVADALAFLHQVSDGATLTVARTGQTPRRDDRVADVDVRSGDRLTLVDSINALFSVTPEAIAATLVVTTTTGTATEYPLRYGDNVLGRDLDCDVVIKDQQASRRHARINVSDVVTITDLGSKNGVVVADKAIATPTVLRPGQDAEIGDLRLSIRDHLRAVEAVASRNRVEFNRPPRVTRPYGGVQIELPAPPDRPRKQRVPMISAVVPVILGVFMYFLLGPIGAIFMLLSPVLLIASWVEAKRTGQFEFKEQLAEHRSMIEEQVQRLEAERDLEVRSRFKETPGAGELGGLVRSLSDRLWERAPDDADFLRLRIGTAELQSRTTVTVASGGARDLRKDIEAIPGRFARLDDVPLAVDLLDHRGIGVAGPLHATRALARSIVMQAAAMHSPTDLAVVALVGEGGLNHWGFLKWLPHARSLGGSQLASTSHHALGDRQRRDGGADEQRPDTAGGARRDRRNLPRRAAPSDAAARSGRHRRRRFPVGLVGPPPPPQGVRGGRRDRPRSPHRPDRLHVERAHHRPDTLGRHVADRRHRRRA